MTNILKNLQEKIRRNLKRAIKNKKPYPDGAKEQKDQLATDWYTRGVEHNKSEFKRFLSHE